MTAKSKILVVSDEHHDTPFKDGCETVIVQSFIRGLACLSNDEFDGVYVNSSLLEEAFQAGKLLQNEKILNSMQDGVVLVNHNLQIIWSNTQFDKWVEARPGTEAPNSESAETRNFFQTLGVTRDEKNIWQNLIASRSCSVTIRYEELSYFFQITATELEKDTTGDNEPVYLLVLRDISPERNERQKLLAIHQAGIGLADLTMADIDDMNVDDRKELLKENILHCTQDVLHYDVIEIRMLDPDTKRLDPLLSYGMRPEASQRELYALPEDNGVTGFVAATGNSYLCEDTLRDPIYLEGAQGAKSSLTVPLLIHEDVIGTFNVESPETAAFQGSDLQFLEIFARDVAAALNTLNLLVAEKVTSTNKSIEAIHGAVALPIDDILNDAVKVMERYIGHEPEVQERLQHILQNARDIKLAIQQIGRNMAPTEALPVDSDIIAHPTLRGQRVLVVDADESIRSHAHEILDRFGCVVETAHDGDEATLMVRSSSYDAIISDIKLPDMSGYDLYCKLAEFMPSVPMIYMVAFGYDADHTQVKARKAGLTHFLMKPFRKEQLLKNIQDLTSMSATSK